MKRNAIFSAMLAGLFLIGCSENSSLNSPVSGASGSLQRVQTSGHSMASAFEVNQVVVEGKTGDSYYVSGTIRYEYSSEAGSYALSIQSSLAVENMDESKKFSAVIEKSDLVSGSIGEGEADGVFVAEHDNIYELEGMPGAILSVRFHLSDKATIHSISIQY